MVTFQQAIRIANAFKVDACQLIGMDPSLVHIEQKRLSQTNSSFPSIATVDASNNTIYIISETLYFCTQHSGFTPLRFEVYSKVLYLYLLRNPDKIINKNPVSSAFAYATAIMMLKGLKIHMYLVNDLKELIKKIVKEEFKVDVMFYQIGELCGIRMDDISEKKYADRYYPNYNISTVEPLSPGDKGTKENPFDNVYEAVEYIKRMEAKAYEKDYLLQDIEKQKFFYDLNKHCFRIHWASSYVSQYTNTLPTRSYFVNQMDTDWFSLKPNLNRHKFLYRGQSDHYEGKPCVPNLFRNEQNNIDRDYIEYLIFSQEMELMLYTHPLVKLFQQGIELLHDTFKIRVNYRGLAQHYYNKSTMLDLSSDLEVMKFFATTNYIDDKYVPCINTSHLGVIYCYELQYPGAFWKKEGYSLKTIGKHIFMRPGAQCGFLLDMDYGVDFKNIPEVTTLYFKHDPKVSEEIFAQSYYSKAYFADDLLQHACDDRLRDRKNNRVVSRKAAELNAYINKITVDEVIEILKSKGITVDDFIPEFTKEELDCYYESIQHGWWEEFCNDIHFYGAEDELYRQELKDLPNRPEYRWAFYK